MYQFLPPHLELSGGVPDLHVDVLLVELRGVRVHLGDLGRVVVDEAPRHVPHDQRWWRKRGNVVMEIERKESFEATVK